jgi:hypothetical protein
MSQSTAESPLWSLFAFQYVTHYSQSLNYQHESQDFLFIATERYKFCILAYDLKSGDIITKANGDLREVNGRPADIGKHLPTPYLPPTRPTLHHRPRSPLHHSPPLRRLSQSHSHRLQRPTPRCLQFTVTPIPLTTNKIQHRRVASD